MRISDWSSDVCSSDLRLQDVRPAIADCNVYVLPSYREGTPRTVLEAMAMGRAIITTDAPGCRQTVQAGHNGLLVQPRSVNELVQAMESLHANPDQVAVMGAHSRTLAETRFNVHKVNAARSEEHTSELQSLMRISYSVFCLKKTTKL